MSKKSGLFVVFPHRILKFICGPVRRLLSLWITFKHIVHYVRVTGHSFSTNDEIVIDGTTNYDGTYSVDADTTTNEIVIVATYAAENFAGTETVTAVSNWKLVSDGSDTAKPTDADVIYFNDRAYVMSSGKRQDCNVNVDAAGTGTPNLDGLYVSAGYDGTIGSDSEPLEINCDGEDIVIDGDCTVYLMLSAGADADAGCGRVVLNNKTAELYLESYLNNATYVCLYDLVVCLQGTLEIGDNCAVTKIIAASNSSTINSGTGIENVKDSELCNILAIKGEIVWLSKIGNIEVFDSSVSWGAADMDEVSGYSCDVLTIYSRSGTFVWQLADTSGSVLKQFELYAGRLQSSPTVNTGYRKTIGTGTEVSELWPDAQADFNSGANNVLLASGSKLEARGGTLIASPGSLLEW